ncbi:MAG TPA: hypothetical protein VGP12_01345 [Nitrosospira sp.]|nr:hypothetical protein [Nitrosospira sp.]
MRRMKLLCAALVLLGPVNANTSWAGGGHGHHHHHGGHHHHGHHHYGGGWGGFGLGLGMGILGYGIGSMARAPYYPPSYGYPPIGYGANYGYPPNYGYAPVAPIGLPPSAPPIYIQQEVVQVQPPVQGPNSQGTSYWHYCRQPEGYYPYIKNCPGGWLQVAPEPRQ